MPGLLDNARPLDKYRALLAPDPGWQYGWNLPLKSRTPLDPIYGAPQRTEFAPAIPGMAREMAGSLLNVLEAPRTGIMPTPADLLNTTPMMSAPGLLAKIPAGALASGVARRLADPDDRLIVQHNTSPSALQRAARLGGFPVPSMAVAKAESPLIGFGDITLIGPPGMAKPSAKNPVWAADAYTTRAPHIDVQPNRVAEDIISKDYGDILGKFKHQTDASDMIAKDLVGENHYSSIPIIAKFLNDKGLLPDPGEFDDSYKFNLAVRGIRDGFKHGDVTEFNAWAKNEISRIKDAGGEFQERIFRGRTPSGNPRYAPATLENMVREMRGKGAGAEGFHHTTGSLRAQLVPRLRSLAEIKRKRGQVASYGKAKTSFDEADQLLANFRGDVSDAATGVNAKVAMDTVDELVEDILLKRGEHEYSKQYMPAMTKKIRDAADELRKMLRDMPTEYFEIKPQRGVALSEFGGAIVPKETSATTLKILKDAGITRVHKYANPAERQALFKKFPEMMFSNPAAAAAPGLLSAQQPQQQPRQWAPRGLLDNTA
jgi:hypothetical protein